jgi:hypothetical protein
MGWHGQYGRSKIFAGHLAELRFRRSSSSSTLLLDGATRPMDDADASGRGKFLAGRSIVFAHHAIEKISGNEAALQRLPEPSFQQWSKCSADMHTVAASQDEIKFPVRGRLQMQNAVDVDNRRAMHANEAARIELSDKFT